uniref:Uncharacterized protein n=1 Tax=Caenorhabditis tropicalis TaxID=1561998 RepID=A0A1I7T8P3_9PELO
MSEVITLSDDDDIEILSPVPITGSKPTTSTNQNEPNQGATVYIAKGSHISLDQIGGFKNTPELGDDNKATLFGNKELAAKRLFSSLVPVRPRIPPQLAIRTLKRSSPSSSTPPNATISFVPSQRTRNSHHSSSSHQIYKGHYMFEATEGYEPSRRSSRFNTKKLKGNLFVRIIQRRVISCAEVLSA